MLEITILLPYVTMLYMGWRLVWGSFNGSARVLTRIAKAQGPS